MGEGIKERMEWLHIQRPEESAGSVTTFVCEERCNGVYMASRLALGFVYDLAHWNEISGWIGSKDIIHTYDQTDCYIFAEKRMKESFAISHLR